MEYQLCVACNRKVPRKVRSCQCGHVLRERVAVKVANDEGKPMDVKNEINGLASRQKTNKKRKPQPAQSQPNIKKPRTAQPDKGTAGKRKHSRSKGVLIPGPMVSVQNLQKFDGLSNQALSANQENMESLYVYGLTSSSKHYPNPLEDINTKLVRQNWFLTT